MLIVWLLGCSSRQDLFAYSLSDEVVEEEREDGILIEGKLFYNDLRTHGVFEYHLDRDGNFGSRCSYHKDDCRQNYLSAVMVEVQLLSNGDVLDSGVVQMDGGYSFLVEESKEVSVRFQLRYCNEQVCFSFRDEKGDIYSLMHPSAHPDSPLSVRKQKGYFLPEVVFQPHNANDGEANNHAHAINHYMGLGEVIYDWNIAGEISFEQDEFAELVVTMPAVIDTVGQTREYDDIQLPENKSTWIKGQKIGHEYGHVIQLRSWQGKYWFEGPQHPSWSAKTEQRKEIAFKEGWANFVPKTSYPSLSCSGGFDQNDSSSGTLIETDEDGHLYPRNVTKLLCDLYDSSNEDDPVIEGAGDQITISEVGILRGYLQDVLEQADSDQRKEGIGMCEYIEAILAARPNERDKLISTVHNNHISCGLH